MLSEQCCFPEHKTWRFEKSRKKVPVEPQSPPCPSLSLSQDLACMCVFVSLCLSSSGVSSSRRPCRSGSFRWLSGPGPREVATDRWVSQAASFWGIQQDSSADQGSVPYDGIPSAGVGVGGQVNSQPAGLVGSCRAPGLGDGNESPSWLSLLERAALGSV